MKLPQSPLFIPITLFTFGGVLSFILPFSFQKSLKLGLVFLILTLLIQLVENLKPIKTAKLIADGSNGPWNLALWEKTCTEQGVEFYNTREKGALRISL